MKTNLYLICIIAPLLFLIACSEPITIEERFRLDDNKEAIIYSISHFNKKEQILYVDNVQYKWKLRYVYNRYDSLSQIYRQDNNEQEYLSEELTYDEKKRLIIRSSFNDKGSQYAQDKFFYTEQLKVEQSYYQDKLIRLDSLYYKNGKPNKRDNLYFNDYGTFVKNYQYNKTGQCIFLDEWTDDKEMGIHTYWKKNAFNKDSIETKVHGKNKEPIWEKYFFYNKKEQLVKITCDSIGIPGCYETLNFEYDEQGRLTREDDIGETFFIKYSTASKR